MPDARARGARAASDHFDGERFFNPSRANGRPITEVPRMLSEGRAPWPARVPVVRQRPAPLGGSDAVLTFVGHSTFLIQTPAGNILTDPVFSERASPLSFVGPKRVREPAVAFEDLPPVAIVLLSHNHYDHCDRPTLRAIARRWNPLAVTPIGNARFLRSFGFRHVEELDWWERSTAAPLPIVLTPAQHFSARTPWDRNRALWGGFFVHAGARRIFFAADTGYAGHFEEIRSRLGEPDLALLPIGAYEPRWFMKDIHMNPEEAVQAHVDLHAARSVGMHFGTFQLTLEGIDEPPNALAAELRRRGLNPATFRAPEFGESIRVD